jgi:glycosyltransferase involved in cell wall biosynthesis
MTKVSVIIPAYNHDQFIGQAIRSILDSDHSEVEILVIDDGSKDKTKSVVQAFDMVRYFYQENSGAHSAINYGLKIATGDVVAILNDDDLFHPNHLSVALCNIEEFGNDFFVGAPEIIGTGWKFDALNEHVLQSKLITEELGYINSLFTINWSTSTSSFVFKSELAKKLGGFHNFSMCHDLDFLLRALFFQEAHVGTSLIPTWEYRCHETNSGSAIKLATQHAEIIYSLGRVLDSILDIPFRKSLIKLLGYGLPVELTRTAFSEKPWSSESLQGTDSALRNWLRDCGVSLR